MARRSRTHPQMSLLAFQDIITAVTGIVIVMVLMLILELPEHNSGSPPSSDTPPLAELQTQLADVHEQIEQLKEQARRAAETTGTLAENSPEDIDREIRQLQAQREQLERDLRQAEQNSRDLRQRAARDASGQQASLQRQLEALRRRIAALEQQLKEEQASQRPLYQMPGSMRQEGWLAVVEQRQIQVAPIGRAARPVTFRGTEAAALFISWLEREQHQRSYFLLLIRPDGPRVFDELEAALARRKVTFGFDAVGQQDELLDPNKGTAP